MNSNWLANPPFHSIQSIMSIDARALPGEHFGQGNGSVLLSNVRCKPARDMTMLECCGREVQKQNRYCNRGDSAGVRCRDDQLVMNVRATLINTLTNTLTHHNILVTWQLQQNSTISRATAVPRSFEVRCFNEIHSIEISLSNTTFTTQVGGLLQGSYYICCVSVVYELYTVKGVCTQAEIPEPELATTQISLSTQAEVPDLITTKVAVARTETLNMLTSEVISAQTKTTELFTTEIVTVCIGTTKSMNVALFGALGTIIAFLVVLSALLCVALICQRSRKSVHKR